MRKLASLALSLAVIGCAASAAKATIVTISRATLPDGSASVVSDATIRSGVKADTVQTAQQLLVGVAATDSTTSRALLSYDLSYLANQAAGGTLTINSVKLVINIAATTAGATNTALQLDLYSYSKFDGTKATWNNPTGLGTDSTAGGTFGSSTLLTSATGNSTVANTGSPYADGATPSFTFASSSAFVAAVNNALAGDHVLNLLINNPSTATSDLIRLAGDRYTIAQSAAIIVDYTVTPVPEAASLSLLGLGAVSLLRRRR